MAIANGATSAGKCDAQADAGGNETRATFGEYISSDLDNGIVFLRRDEIADIFVHCWDATKGFPSSLPSSLTDGKY